MNDASTHLTVRQRQIFAAILVTGLAARLLVAWLPVPLLIEKTIPDDAFYYFAIARNVVAGHGASVDGLTPTNGFHPLWGLLLALPYALFRDGDLPIHLGLSLAALADTLSAAAAFYLVRRVTGRAPAGLLAAGLYAFNPLAAMESQNGLETSLAGLFFALTGLVYLTRVRAGRAGFRDYALLGLAAGLMLLARTDTLFLLLVIALDSLWRRWRASRGPAPAAGGQETARRFVLHWGLAGLIIGALLLPWFWWNMATFGTFVQSSAVAAPRLIRYSLTTPLARGEPPAAVFQERYAPILLLSGTLGFRYAGLALSAAAVALILSRLLAGRFPSLRASGPLWLPMLGAALPLLVHTFVRWYPRSWYYVPLAWAAAVLGGALIDRAAGGWPRWQRLGGRLPAAGVAVLVLLLALQSVKAWREGFYPWQGHMLAGARWAAESAPPQAVVASFNSGLQAYYGRRPIVNLDGVVNWEALAAMERRGLLDYARRRGVTHLIDYQTYIFDSFSPFFEEGFRADLRPVAELSPGYPPYGAVAVYEIKYDEGRRTKN